MKFLKKGMQRILIFTFLILMGFASLNYYFTHIFVIRTKIIASVEQKIHEYHIHALSFNEIPIVYQKAVISTEDRRFWTDPGIDPIGIIRSLIVDVQKDGYIEGGSTITQQLVDNTILKHQKTIKYKLTQALYAIGLYDTMSKRKVFTLYANIIYFGHGAYGLYNAAETYFGKTPSQLNSGELTLLAGLPNAPSVYDPFKSISLARQRQKVVIDNMVDSGSISQTSATHILKEPIHLL